MRWGGLGIGIELFVCVFVGVHGGLRGGRGGEGRGDAILYIDRILTFSWTSEQRFALLYCCIIAHDNILWSCERAAQRGLRNPDSLMSEVTAWFLSVYR